MNELELHLKKKMLKWHVGHDIFCPSCKRIMDCNKAVEIDFMRDGELAGSKVVCASCFDAKLANGRIEEQAAPQFTVEINDGRKLFARRRKVA